MKLLKTIEILIRKRSLYFYKNSMTNISQILVNRTNSNLI